MATSAVRDRIIVPVVVNPAPLGINLNNDNGWIAVSSIAQTSQLKNKVIVGDWIERINYTHVKGLKPCEVVDILQDCKDNGSPFTIFFLRRKKDPPASAGSNAMTRASDVELITPPAKRLKETSGNQPVAKLPAAVTVAPTPQVTVTAQAEGTENRRVASRLPAVATATPTPPQSTTATQFGSRNQHVSVLPAAVTAATMPPAESAASQPPQPSYMKATELRQVLSNDKKTRPRPYVKETLVRAYELHVASRMMQDMLEKDENAKKNACLVEHYTETIQTMQKESQDILAIPEELLHTWEFNLLKLIKYIIATNEPSVSRCKTDSSLNKWMQKQRGRRNSLDAGNKDSLGKGGLKTLHFDIAILDRLGFVWKARDTKYFDDYFQEISAFKQEHGHVRVPRILPDSNLGEWVHRMRNEYDEFNHGKKVPSLNPERIDMLNELGFIWKIRHGRPKKGDARFRLRRRGDAGTSAEKQDEKQSTEETSADARDSRGGNNTTEPDAPAQENAAQAQAGTKRDNTDLNERVSTSTWL